MISEVWSYFCVTSVRLLIHFNVFNSSAGGFNPFLTFLTSSWTLWTSLHRLQTNWTKLDPLVGPRALRSSPLNLKQMLKTASILHGRHLNRDVTLPGGFRPRSSQVLQRTDASKWLLHKRSPGGSRGVQWVLIKTWSEVGSFFSSSSVTKNTCRPELLHRVMDDAESGLFSLRTNQTLLQLLTLGSTNPSATTWSFLQHVSPPSHILWFLLHPKSGDRVETKTKKTLFSNPWWGQAVVLSLIQFSLNPFDRQKQDVYISLRAQNAKFLSLKFAQLNSCLVFIEKLPVSPELFQKSEYKMFVSRVLEA